MRVMAIQEHGGPERLERMDLPRPRAARGEILVRAVAAGVDPVDCALRAGRLAGTAPVRFPFVPGFDVAGVVEELGEGVSGFRKGDRVWAMVRRAQLGSGCYAEYVAVPEPMAALMPSKLLYEEAAAVPLAALAAWQGLFVRAAATRGDTVLVHDAAGGPGHLAVQLAQAAGCRVLAVCRPDDRAFVVELGAEAVIDATGDDVEAAVQRLAPEGAGVVLDDGVGDALAVAPAGEQLREIARRFDQKKLRVHVERILSLAEAPEAHRILERGPLRGKLVLNL